MEKYPNFLIVGAAKSGTTTLFKLLKQHPQVFVPKRKELNFWYTYNSGDRAIFNRLEGLPKTKEAYLECFKGSTDFSVLGEASPGYLVYYKETIANIKAHHPNPDDVKIIIILREPIEKVWSHYKMVKRGGMDPDGLSLWDSLSKEEERKKNTAKYLLDVLPVFSTDYLPQVKAFKEEFKEVHVILFEDLEKFPQETLDAITSFLEVDKIKIDTSSNLKYNAAPKVTIQDNWFVKIVRGLKINAFIPESLKAKRRARIIEQLDEKMDEKSLRLLKNKFKIDVPKLEKLIEKDLSHWSKKYKN